MGERILLIRPLLADQREEMVVSEVLCPDASIPCLWMCHVSWNEGIDESLLSRRISYLVLRPAALLLLFLAFVFNSRRRDYHTVSERHRQWDIDLSNAGKKGKTGGYERKSPTASLLLPLRFLILCLVSVFHFLLVFPFCFFGS